MFKKYIFDKVFDRSYDLGVPDDDYPGDDDVFEPDLLPDEGKPQIVEPAEVEPNPHLLEVDISNRVQISSCAHKQLVLVGHDGLTSAPSELAHIDHAILDGGLVSGARAQSRRITFDFAAKDMTYSDISSLFPLGQKETIWVSRAGVTRSIEGYRDGPLEVSAVTALATPVVSVSFLCPFPYFVRDVVHRHDFMSAVSGLEYPKEYPISFGSLVSDNTVFCANRGDYPTSFVLEMRANSDGQISVSAGGLTARIVGISAGDLIVLDTGRRMLFVNHVKRFDLFDGAFPAIPVGGGEVVLDDFSGTATISYSEIFEGV